MARLRRIICARKTVGDVVTYVINSQYQLHQCLCQSLRFFAAFSRGHLAEEGYFLPMEEILRRAREAQRAGRQRSLRASGLGARHGRLALCHLCRSLKEEFPDLHITVFSRRVLYGSTLTGATLREYLTALKDAAWAVCRALRRRFWSMECANKYRPGESPRRNGSS